MLFELEIEDIVEGFCYYSVFGKFDYEIDLDVKRFVENL